MSKFSLAPVFSDNMVLQMDKPIKVWGTGDDARITVCLGEEKVTVRPINGHWTASMPPQAASEGLELTVYADKGSQDGIFIHNVAIGEVWIAGGQSNMTFPLRYDEDYKKEAFAYNNPSIRFFDQPKITYQGEQLAEDFSEYGFWRVCDQDNLPYYSAVAFYFAKKIQETLNVPVGIVGCNLGGTTAAAWLSEDYLKGDCGLKIYLDEYTDKLKEMDCIAYEKHVADVRSFLKQPDIAMLMEGYMAGTISEERILCRFSQTDPALLVPYMGQKDKNRPSGLYHTMVQEVAGYSARGVIWYQGEQDEKRAGIYDRLFSAVINCWRETWSEELPFIFTQLAPFGGSRVNPDIDFVGIRQKQEAVSNTVPKAYMASIMDAGMRSDIHPKKKKPVGQRMALLALGKVYGENIVCEAPQADSARLEDETVIVKFKNVGEGLKLIGESINSLELLAEGTKIEDFSFGINFDELKLTGEGIKNACEAEVRLAWVNYAQVNLYNSADLPAKPFAIKIHGGKDDGKVGNNGEN